MALTLRQARKKLAKYENAFGVIDIRDAINDAVESLSGMAPWECLRRVVRFVSPSPDFSLPQGYAGLVRVCVNGAPTSLRTQDFNFLPSGPGDFASRAFKHVHLGEGGVVDLGFHPVMRLPHAPFQLFAMSGTVPAPPLKVKCVDVDGHLVNLSVPVTELPEYGDTDAGYGVVSGTDPNSADVTGPVVTQVSSVTVDDDASDYVQLWARIAGTGETYQIADYHPEVKAPRFRHYTIQGVRRGPVEILAETRVDPLPLVRESDVLPFDDVAPIKYMIMYDWKMESSEVDTANKYMQQALQWLRSQETTNDTSQGQIVLNQRYSGSLGEISDYVNMV